jgi:redox-sensitive bicupin YhaK (pirin superfamily)
MSLTIYPPERQGVGEFDEGKFIEQRPIGFPGDSSSVSRLGPLFYWAWGKADQKAVIGLHPHQAFEIMTYVISGEVEHSDSLGTKQTVTTGGAQVMQAGSGMNHAEAFLGGEPAEAFQIWFEPHLNETIKHKPKYNQFTHNQFPNEQLNGVTIKTIIGDGAPIHIEADSLVKDIAIPSGMKYEYKLSQGRFLSFLVIRGSGTVNQTELNHTDPLIHKDFVVIQANSPQVIVIQANVGQDLRVVTIEVPTKVNYPLYRK